MARFGVDEAQIAAGRVDERWRALLAFETARARALLQPGGRCAARCRGGSASSCRR